MQVSFNPVKQNFNNTSFKQAKKESDFYYQEKPSRDEILTAKTKKAVSECKYTAFAIGIMYFAMKRNFKVEKIKNHERELAQLAKLKKPSSDLFHILP